MTVAAQKSHVYASASRVGRLRPASCRNGGRGDVSTDNLMKMQRYQWAAVHWDEFRGCLDEPAGGR